MYSRATGSRMLGTQMWHRSNRIQSNRPRRGGPRVSLLVAVSLAFAGCDAPSTIDASPPGADTGLPTDAGTDMDAGADASDCATPPNACGGCGELIDLGSPCGPCGLDVMVCDGPESLSCDGTTECPSGTPCSSDTECASGYCSPNGCAPAGWSFVPAATFIMGAPTDERGFHTGRENGQHTVTLTRDFLVSQTVVTQGQWRSLMGNEPSYHSSCGDECPVERITWFGMLAYANALSAREGLPECYDLRDCVGTAGAGCRPDLDHCNGYVCDVAAVATPDLDCLGYRLPTESEWEYFARAGRTTAFLTASGLLADWSPAVLDPELDAIAWYISNSAVTYTPAYDCSIWYAGAGPCGPQAVAQKLPNDWGLYDITGNVYERVWDWSGDYPAPGSSVIDPTGQPTGTQKRMRGGSFNLWGQYMRVAYRTGPIPAAAYYNIGFRLVRTLP